MPKNTNKKTLKKKEFNNSELKPTNKQAYLNCFFLILKWMNYLKFLINLKYMYLLKNGKI